MLQIWDMSDDETVWNQVAEEEEEEDALLCTAALPFISAWTS